MYSYFVPSAQTKVAFQLSRKNFWVRFLKQDHHHVKLILSCHNTTNHDISSECNYVQLLLYNNDIQSKVESYNTTSNKHGYVSIYAAAILTGVPG